MALKKTISINGTVNVMTEHGPIPDGQKIVSLNCYIKVENVTSTKSVANAVVKFTDNNRSISKTYIFEPDMNGENIIKQTYEHLKTLPEFAGAEDC